MLASSSRFSPSPVSWSPSSSSALAAFHGLLFGAAARKAAQRIVDQVLEPSEYCVTLRSVTTIYHVTPHLLRPPVTQPIAFITFSYWNGFQEKKLNF